LSAIELKLVDVKGAIWAAREQSCRRYRAGVVIDKSGEWWVGNDAGDLDEYLKSFKAGGYDVHEVAQVDRCTKCEANDGFQLRVDDEEGFAERKCAACGNRHLMLDSADQAESATPGDAACPCGHEVFDAGVGISNRKDGEIRWVSIGLRCRNDGVLGCYVDWKIDYSPTDALRNNA
jgi:hypothetical protein